MSNTLIGIIAEDDSDVNCIKHFVRRINPTKTFGFKKFVGHGCGKISRKANSWAKVFKTQGCHVLILVHDLDRNKMSELDKRIQDALLPSPIKKYLICIPTEELEAWLLSDEIAFKSIFNIKKELSLPKHPETVTSPKEFIGKIVRTSTDKKVDYINAKHNEKLAEIINISNIEMKCPSFAKLKVFIDKI